MFRLARKLADKSPFQRHRLGAVIVKNGRVLSTGYNEIRYSKITGHSTVHAEEAAIIKLLSKGILHGLQGSDIFVSRTTPGGRCALAKPCPRCTDLISSVGIKRIYYTVDDNNTNCIKL